MATTRPGPAPAVTELARRGVDFTLHPYDLAEYDEGAEIAELLDVDGGRVLEVLVVEAGGRAALCLVVVGAELDDRSLEQVLGAPARVLADVAAERITGQPADAVSPFGLRRPLPALLDEPVAALGADTTVVVPSGQPGLVLEMRLDDLVRASGARTVAITC